MNFIPRVVVPFVLLCLSSAPVLAQWTITPLRQVRVGTITYGDGHTQDQGQDSVLGANSGAAIGLARSLNCQSAHLEVTFTFAVRYTARQVSEKIPDSFNGLSSRTQSGRRNS